MASPITVRDKLAGWRAAESAARAARRISLDPAELLEAAQELRDLNPLAFEGPDAVREREVAEVRNAWNTLRRRWRRHDTNSQRA